MPTIDEQIATLSAKLDAAKKRKRLQNAREKAAKAKAIRSLDTRRKILVGAYYLNLWKDNKPPQELIDWLSETDRKVFE